ncbi:MAG TPA: NrfD/PsrC family molybdoenzyme membrane anchor subunit [Burkholderiaceae bacterium]|nr:NrfD/PsrC family molybdoenzyme membrane anchor subunit [Burkholderiaceae bacterium]
MALRPSADFDAPRFWALVALGGAVLVAGLGAAHVMEVEGHVVTGMDNQVVWGLPHVFAIFLIVVASGVLNVASIGTVFGRAIYKARGALSGLLSLATLAGGLTVLMLDLGRPDRVVVAATRYNFRSVFAWNVFLYSGLAALVVVYLWTMLERRMKRYARPVGLAAFVWRLVLTTGTGSIFAFLVARQAYASAVLAPLFIVLSFAWGLAVFVIVEAALNAWNATSLHPAIVSRMRSLLGLFVVASLYFVAIYHVTNLYFARQVAFERFILVDGGVFPWLFWVGYAVIGGVLPLLLVWLPKRESGRALLAASALTAAGGFALLYVFIIGGQSFPLEIFPGFAARSTFGDGATAHYAPSVWEALLGCGGLAAAFLITLVGVRVFDFVPHDDTRALEAAVAGGKA